jgi:GNAT superfamily N-acetyltransferase
LRLFRWRFSPRKIFAGCRGIPPAAHAPITLNAISVRNEQPGDEPFLLELYVSRRQAEMDALGWPAEMRNTFLHQQFRASQGYHTAYPDAEFQIIRVNGVNAGRLIINRTREELRVVDVALLPQFRNAGVGTSLLRKLFGEANATCKPVRLRVDRGSPAEQLYQRLGFARVAETELQFEMEWRPAAENPVPRMR